MSGDKETKKKGILKWLNIVFWTILSFILALVFSVIIEWLGMSFGWWSLSGSEHAKSILVTEYAWLYSEYKTSIVKPVNIADLMMSWFDAEVVRSDAFTWIALSVGANNPVIEYLYAMVFVVQTVLLRLTVILMSFPALMLFACFALIDGFSERDIRTWSVGGETSFVYHHAKSYIAPLMIFPVVLYLSIPASIHPFFFMLLFVLPPCLMVWILAKYFKKNL
jgi:integrating conjugative element membrane protein (TIGR03747 family)